MVWWCTKHEQHSCDDVCWKCDHDHDQPYIDAFNAGWDARQELYSSEATEEKKDEQLAAWKIKNQSLLLCTLRGVHE